MSKFSRLSQATAPGGSYPGAQTAPAPGNQQPPYPGAQNPSQPQYGYGQPAQPAYQPPQWQQPRPQNSAYGAQPSAAGQQPYQSPQPAYNSYQSQYQQPQYGQQPQYSQPGGGYGAQPGQPGGYPPQSQGRPPQQQGYGGPGGPGAPPQQQYGGAPPQAATQNAGAYRQLLQAAIQEKGLQNFYPPGSPALEQIVNRAGQQVAQLAANWRIPTEIASDIVKLALYDVILYIDDSGSMAFEENGERIDDLKVILSRVAFATSLFDEDGIQVRFMNSAEQGNGIRSEQQVNEMVARTKFSGLTPMGRELQNKILGPLVISPARSGQLRKPVLVITITDGQPTGESSSDVARIIKGASDELARNPRLGKGALAFQFAQVGNDLKAREFLGKLDEEPTIGDIIDCTSNYEVEADEMMHANPPVNLTPELWLIKLLLGAIDSSYDTQDEKSSGGRPPVPPGGGYGGGGYPQQQQGGYPPQQGYGQQPGGYPPQQGYGQQQPQGQYGRPPPPGPGGPGGPGGYPGQGGQGGYGAPPPPPRY